LKLGAKTRRGERKKGCLEVGLEKKIFHRSSVRESRAAKTFPKKYATKGQTARKKKVAGTARRNI